MRATDDATSADAAALPLRFATRAALAALPWFEIDHGEIVLADRAVGPIIDTHTHYALPTLSIHHLDMRARRPTPTSCSARAARTTSTSAPTSASRRPS
jgi:hypothetical protein